MITLITTGSHTYTHRYVRKRMPAFRVMTYPELLMRRRLPAASYIFSDFDRLSFFQLELAAHVFRQLAAAGLRTLNDPARTLQRLDLLRRLHAEGVNSFKVWPASEADRVDRFPVFIRTIRAHRGVLTDLITTGPDLHTALEGLVEAGWPASDLMIAEYRAQPNADGVFRKLSSYKIGSALVATPSVHERHWAAKYGEMGAAGEDGYVADLQTVRDNPHSKALERAFALARIEYGRADFGLVDGRVEIYEINTNPMIEPATQHPFPERIEAFRIADERYFAALEAIDTPTGKDSVEISLPASLSRRRRRVRMMPGYQWMP